MDTMAHPLDPLIPAEIETAVAIVHRERSLGDDVPRSSDERLLAIGMAIEKVLGRTPPPR